jgi:hypothetical protein
MFNKQTTKTLLVGLGLILTLIYPAAAQTKRKATRKKSAKKAASVKTGTVAENEATPAVKKNSRPETENQTVIVEKTNETVKTNARPAPVENKSVYFYEFSKAEFIVSKISIEHDENGKGKITFQKKDFAEEISDPLQLSPAALERVKTVWSALNFLDSTENYQAVKDFSHLGTMKFTMRKAERTREAAFNWTDNKNAKSLADEYRKIGQQFVWIFDINVARENQPLDAPRLLGALDSLIKRNEVSDARQMIPFLEELSQDERLPLIARNRATKLKEKIEKSKSDK